MPPTPADLEKFEKDLTVIVSKSRQQAVFVHEAAHVLSPQQLRHDIDVLALGLLEVIQAAKLAGASLESGPNVANFAAAEPSPEANTQQ